MKTLFIIGAQRSGSTYLYKVLDDHPEISLAHPVRPEPKFFLNEVLVKKGQSYYENNYFLDRKKETVYFGEKSTSYMESELAAKSIYHFYPDSRILIILRDPVQRAYSNYLFTLDNKLEDLTFVEALKSEEFRLQNTSFTSSVSPYSYRQRGKYVDYINMYLKIFDPEQLCILIYEEFVGNIDHIQSLYAWLEVNKNIIPQSFDKSFNVSNMSTKKMKDEMPAFIDLIDYYQESIACLERLIGRKINIWHEQHARIRGI
ncbi:MAG: sulfotransferase family protein [Leptospirales bacterium]